MQDHYKTLGINSSATYEEVRRAYRVLARRYHPDVNPGKASEEKFKAISSAYQVLSDDKRRADYDAVYERIQIAAFAEKFRTKLRKGAPKKSSTGTAAQREKPAGGSFLKSSFKWYKEAKKDAVKKLGNIRALFRKTSDATPSKVTSVSIIEVSISIKEAIFGQKKTVEIPQSRGSRKISINIPAGVRSGSVLRLRQRSQRSEAEEIVIIIRVAQHPFLTLQNKGLVVEVPVSLSEALLGANVTLPSLDESVLVKIPPGSQSGTEIRVKEKGVLLKDGTRGDIVYRLLVRLPNAHQAVGIAERTNELDKYYEEPVRRNFPENFLNL